MSEENRAKAVAVLAGWFADLFKDDDFRAKVEDQAPKNQAVTLPSVWPGSLCRSRHADHRNAAMI